MHLQTVQSQSKYGLVKKTGSSKPVKKLLASNYFDNGDDDIEEEDNRIGVNMMLKRDSSKVDAKTLKIYESAIAQDSNIFDYDESYDKFKLDEKTSHPLSAASSGAPVAISHNLSNISVLINNLILESEICW